MMKMRFTFLLLATLGATPAQAGTFTAPEGCSIWMTVQARACRVSNYYKCSQDAPGDQWRADFDQEGIFFTSRVDHEAQWIESRELPAGIVQTLDANPADPASFSALLSAGLDPWTFGLSRTDGIASRVTGQDALTGAVITIDGIALRQTAFDYTETDPAGNIIRRSRGNEYLHPEWRLFFGGPGETDLGDGQWLPTDGSPVEFIFPGEPGFAATQPLFECDDLMSGVETGPAITPARYQGGMMTGQSNKVVWIRQPPLPSSPTRGEGLRNAFDHPRDLALPGLPLPPSWGRDGEGGRPGANRARTSSGIPHLIAGVQSHE